jgi:hypothetical protein
MVILTVVEIVTNILDCVNDLFLRVWVDCILKVCDLNECRVRSLHA